MLSRFTSVRRSLNDVKMNCNNNHDETSKNNCNRITKKYINSAEFKNLKLTYEYLANGLNGTVLKINEIPHVVVKNIKSKVEQNVNERIMKYNAAIHSPHFLYVYGVDYSNDHFNLFFEKADGNITQLINGINLHKFNIENIIIQIILAVYTLHRNIGYYYVDSKFDNILYTKLKKNQTYTYAINFEKFTLKNVQYTVHLADFGDAQLISPYVVKALSDGKKRSKLNFESDAAFTYLVLDYLKPLCEILIDKTVRSDRVLRNFKTLSINTLKLLHALIKVLLEYDTKIKKHLQKQTMLSITYMHYLYDIEEKMLIELINTFIAHDRNKNMQKSYTISFEIKSLIFNTPPNELNGYIQVPKTFILYDPNEKMTNDLEQSKGHQYIMHATYYINDFYALQNYLYVSLGGKKRKTLGKRSTRKKSTYHKLSLNHS